MLCRVYHTQKHTCTHTCFPLTTPAPPHISNIVSAASVSPENKYTYIMSILLKPIMTRSALFSQRGRLLEVLVVNAKLAEFSSSPHMQSASCMIFELELHKTLSLIHMKQIKLGHTTLWLFPRISKNKTLVK